MGDRPSTIWSRLWSDPDFEKLDKDGKLLFMYLVTTDRITTSGVYMDTRLHMHRKTGVSMETIDQNLLHGGFRTVSYDAHNNAVFIHNRWRYNRRGIPDIIVKSIIGDYWANPKASQIWKEFRNKYREQIMNNPTLHDHFFSQVDLEAANPMPLLLGSTPLTPYSEKFGDDQSRESEIQRILAQYIEAVPKDDFERILRVWRYFSMTKGSGVPLAPKTRLGRLQWQAKRPIEQVCRAVYLFEKAKGIECGKPWAYFEQVMNGGAKTWYVSYRKATDQIEEQSIGARRPERPDQSGGEELQGR